MSRELAPGEAGHLPEAEPFFVADELTVHLPEHAILLEFENDSGAEVFQEWLVAEGRGLFERWLANRD